MKELIAILIALSVTTIIIAAMWLTSFERHHAHDWPHHQGNTSNVATDENGISDGPLITDADGVKTPRATKPRNYADAYTSQDSLQHYDHKAQIIMAAASLIAVFATIWGLLLLAKTLTATKDAAQSAAKTLKQAELATDAANRTVSVTRDMGVAQSRAYISVKQAKIWVPVIDVGVKGWKANIHGNIHFTLAPIFENTGSTPAYNVSYKFQVSILRNNKKVLKSNFGDPSSFGVIGHKSDTTGGPVYMASTDFPATDTTELIIVDNTVRCWIVIRVEYSDVFDNRWFVESIFQGQPSRAQGEAVNVKDLILRHQTASDKHGKIQA